MLNVGSYVQCSGQRSLHTFAICNAELCAVILGSLCTAVPKQRDPESASTDLARHSGPQRRCDCEDPRRTGGMGDRRRMISHYRP